MRVLVLGGHGMAGHVIRDYLTEASEHEVWWTTRQHPVDPHALYLDARDDKALHSVIQLACPDVVVNAIGVLGQAAEDDPVTAIQLNSLLPRKLASLGDDLGFRLIHISTDCVFSGTSGNYRETAPTDGTSVYAKTKSLGEVTTGPHLTIRTSIIGPELKDTGIGLFHWFMHQQGEIHGYEQVYWNGVTTLELAKLVRQCLTEELHGLVHLCYPERISKHDLLGLFQTTFGKLDVKITPTPHPVSDKTLLSTRSDFLWPTASYESMLEELRDWMRSNTRGAYSYAH